MRGSWVIADYGAADYVNLLDEWGGKVAWQIRREHAERILAGVALLAATEPDDEDDADDLLDDEDDALGVFGTIPPRELSC